MALTDYDILECPRCDKPTKPRKVYPSLSVSYRCKCGDGIRYSWVIKADGSMSDTARQELD